VFDLFDHQIDALKRLNNGSVLVGGVGSGKSVVALQYFKKAAYGKKVVVVTTAKKRDTGEWFKDAAMVGLGAELEVISWNGILNCQADRDTCFIFDEQRVVGYGVWTKAFLEITKHNPWLLLSATPADAWMDLVPVFIAHGYFKNKTQFCNEHVQWSRFAKFPKVERYVNTGILETYRRRIYVEMPYKKPTERHDHVVQVGFDQDEQRMIWTERWNIYEEEPIKDMGEVVRLLRKSANSHDSRYLKLVDICSEHPRVIVFYNHNYELDILRGLAEDLDYTVAEWNGHKHDPLPDTEEWVYLVQYQAGSEGWNCITTDTVVFYSLPYSYRNYEQAKGRIDRLDTKYVDLHYYIFKSKAIIDTAIWRNLMRKKNFNVTAFKKNMSYSEVPTQPPIPIRGQNAHQA
jgi:hypothetical protein